MMQRPELKAWVQAYRYTAILDSVTTPICRGLHGKIFTDETLNGYIPPVHFNALAEGTMIRTKEGTIAIENVFPGMEVWTHRKRWRKVYAQMGKPSDDGRIRNLLLSSGRSLRVTNEHPVLRAFPGGGWKHAGDLQVGDVLFEHCKDVSRASNHVLPHPEDFPSLLDEPESPWPIMRLSSPTPMALPVDLQNEAGSGEGEISDVSPDGMLKNKISTGRDKVAVHDRFVRFRVVPELLGPTGGHLFGNSLHPRGVPILHSDGMGGMNGACFLSQAPSPMGLSTRLVRIEDSIRDGGLFYAGPDGDVVALAPLLENGFSDSKVALDGPKGFPSIPVLQLDQGIDGGSVSQVDHDSSSGWATSAIISIVDEECKGNVWNLAVEEDETYLAEDVIVHNCRSMLLPVTLLDVGWQAEMAGQGPITVKPQEGFATGTVLPSVQEAARAR
jgi:hypothetical protein